ncbi:MAG: 30S ribosomal protein S6 [Desulfarculaceae bacterium]|nr:30S ribosomal protein S6 [Desulfarculaceae bacterium]
MRKYETVFISHPDLQEQARKDLFEKVKNIVAKENGILVEFDDWGNKKLAYEIRKNTRGHYVCMTFGGNGDTVREMERIFRLDDSILKFMTTLKAKDVDPEELKQEAEQTANADEQPSEKTAEATETD